MSLSPGRLGIVEIWIIGLALSSAIVGFNPQNFKSNVRFPISLRQVMINNPG